MKRLAILAVTAVLAVVLSACGESAEKRAADQRAAEKNTPSSMQQNQDNTMATPAPEEANKPAGATGQ